MTRMANAIALEHRDFVTVTPPPEWFIERYGGDDASDHHAEVLDLESQLASVWPGWRHKAPYGHLPVATIERIKRLMMRRMLVIQGKAAWGVRTIYKPKRLRSGEDVMWPLTTPVRPPPSPILAQPDVAPNFGPMLSIPHLAASCKLPIEVVERALIDKPRSVGNARQWCLDWHAEHPAPKAKRSRRGGK